MLSIIVEVVCRSHNRNNEDIFTGSGSVMGAVLLIIKDLPRVLMSSNCHTSAIVKHECNTSVLVNNGLWDITISLDFFTHAVVRNGRVVAP